MSELKIGVMGAGAIGCFVGGRLAARGHSVVFVGRDRLKAEVRANGMTVESLTAQTVKVSTAVYETDLRALRDCDVVLLCVKSTATAETAEALGSVLKSDAVVVSLQNGVRNPDLLRERMKQKVLAGIVTFNVVEKGKGTFRQTTTGPLVIEAMNGEISRSLSHAIRDAGIELDRVVKMRELQWSKLLINLNNAIGALSDRPTKEIVETPGYRRVLGSLILEGLRVLKAAGIKPARLGRFPVGVMARALFLPTPLFRIVARAQLQIDPEARSSMWADLTSNRPTEVDWINGEIVALAEKHGTSAPLNARIVEMVHGAEGKGSPRLSAARLRAELGI